MDLGIKGRQALVCGASRGLGKACALALAREGVNLTIIARTRDVLERTGAEIAQAAGFAHQSHMARHMRRVLGMPPMAMKRLLAETAAS